ncbi:MAG: glycosyltransferase family 4 protein [Deferribacterales bacterium]
MKTCIINAIPLLSPLSGVGRYTLELCRRLDTAFLEADFTYFYGYNSKSLRFPDTSDNVKNTKMLSNVLIRKIAKKMLTTAASLSPKRYDLYWEPNNLIEDFFKARARLYTLHDISVIKHPQWHPKKRVELFANRLRRSIEKADLIITDSRFSNNEITEYFNLPKESVRTIYLGYDTDLFHNICNNEVSSALKNKYTGGCEFILFSGSLEPRKNLSGLLKAYSSLPLDIKENFRLLLVGGTGWSNEEILQLINNNSPYVVHGGYVDYYELATLYRAASLLAYPSHYEGFGLPPLEAMACGCPTLVSPRASLPEVCGDASFYVDPDSVESIREGLIKILTDTSFAQRLSQSGLIQCKKFDWNTTAAEHMKCMRELL